MINIQYIGKTLLQALVNQDWGVLIPYSDQTAQEKHYNGAAKRLYEDLFPAQVFLGFFTAEPTVNPSTGAVTYSEVSGGNYKRQELTKMGPGNSRILVNPDIVQRKVGIYTNTSDANPAYTITKSVARTRNHNEIVLFPYTGSSAYSSAIVYFGLFDAETQGNLVVFGELKASVSVTSNIVPVILKDGLEITLG